MQEQLEYYLTTLRDAVSQKIEDLNPTKKRILEFILMFLVLSVIYSTYLVDFMELGDRDLSYLDKSLFTSILKFFFHIGWPFLVLRLLDEEWQIQDTQIITLITFFVCTSLWIRKYNLNACIGGAAVLFAPLFFSALLFHGLGTLWHRKQRS